MTTIYSASLVQPVSAPAIANGAVAVDGDVIVAVGPTEKVIAEFSNDRHEDFGNSVIIPGLINTHTHLELTVMRGYLENEERDFFAWLKKLTLARLELLTTDDLYVSAAWGACEAVRAGITSVGDASDSGRTSIAALRDVGMRGIVFQESFGPDPKLIAENFAKLKDKVASLREGETSLVKTGVSPHAPYTVCKGQLELIAKFALDHHLPLMMHAAESVAEDSFMRKGTGHFAEGLTRRGIEFEIANCSTIHHLKQTGILETKPLLAHCIRVDESDLELLLQSEAKVAHCPKSNAKLGHGHAPLTGFLKKGITVGLGSDSVASNNTCDLFEEGRFAALMARVDELDGNASAGDVFHLATIGGAKCLGLDTQVGDLRPGLQADLTVVALSGVHQIPSYDAVASLIFTSSGHDVVATIVAGKEVYRDGKVATVDEERLRKRVEEIKAKLL